MGLVRNRDELTVLAPAISAVRRELSDRDEDAVPQKLRKAARATGRSVPAPHQQAMLAHVESDDEFRAAVLDRWDKSEPSDSVSHAYLSDPEGAAPLIAAAASMIALGRAEAERDLALERASDLAAQLEEAKGRLSEAKQRAKVTSKERTAADRRSRQGLERTAESARRDHADALETIAGLELALASEHAATDDLRATVRRLTDREARRVSSGGTPLPERKSRNVLPTDPAELAAFLDGLERRLRYYREPNRIVDRRDEEPQPLELPNGISPESAEAVGAILEEQPDRFIIDGYNVAGAILFEEFSSRAGRKAAVARADMLKRSTDATVTVVFDAANVKGRTRVTTDFGVRVIFEPEVSADDAIVFLVQETVDRSVVITNDRELQSRVARPDCVVLYTTALVAWSEHLNDS